MKKFKEFLLDEKHLKPGDKVKVMHPAKGKGMVTGKIVRYDKGGPESPFYIVAIPGLARSEKVPAHKLHEGTYRGKPSLFDKEDGTQEKWMKEIDRGIKAEVVFTHKSAIGKEDIMIGISLDPKKNWTNNIYQNSRYSQFHLDPGGGLQQFAKHFRLDKFRKTKVKTAKAAVDKINTWISKVESIPYKP